MAQICNRANIILIFINHITQAIAIGPTPVAADVNYLKQGEASSGGKTAVYVTDTLIKITPSSKLEEDKKFQIKGFEAKVEICKSRRAPAGRAVNMIYDQVNGFRDDLSILDYINANGALKGNGMAYYLEGYDKVKFRYSNFVEKLREEPEFREYFYTLGSTLLLASVKESRNIVIVEKDVAEEIIANE